MVNSGVKLSQQTLSVYEEYAKDHKSGFKMVIEKPAGKKNSEVTIVEDSIQAKDAERPLHTLFLEGNLGEKSPCYIAVNVRYEDKEGRKQSKLLLICWNSDNAGIKDKMLYSSTFSTVRDKFKQVQNCITVSDKDDISPHCVLDKLCSAVDAPAVSLEGRPVHKDENTNTWNFTD